MFRLSVLPPTLQICWGCKHTLELMASGDTVFGSYYAHEPGGSPSWLFQVRRCFSGAPGVVILLSTPWHPSPIFQVRTNRTSSGWAVVKTWCVPVLKVKQRGYAPCSPKKAFTQVKLLLAQQQVSERI